MRLNTNDFARKCQFPLMLASGTLPVATVLLALVDNKLYLVSWLFPAAYLLLSLLGLVLPGKIRFVFGLLSLFGWAALVALTSEVLQGFHAVMIAVSLFYAFLLFWTLGIAGWTWDEEIPSLWILFGVAVHVIGQLLLTALDAQERPLGETAKTIQLIAFLFFIFLAMLSMNRDSMATATAHRFRAAFSMRWKNTLLTLVFFAIALGIFMIPAVVSAVENATALIVVGFMLLFDLLFPMVDTSMPDESVVSSAASSGWAPVTEREPNRFVEVIEYVLIILAVVLVLVLLASVLIQVVREGYRLFLFTVNNIGRYAGDVAEDYEDTVTDTREPDGKEKVRRPRLGRRVNRVDERRMEPGERIRYRYMRLLMKHPEWSKGNTARENLASDAAPLYERARYSAHPISEDEAEQFADKIHTI